ncbi:NADPH-dependent FMN reductase [Microvirga antarctica]|uniref:NADPH-dependent FMN reductase n=1 Tax=Microvirga antarctica TaxID=2819233 RepID=UPI001B310EF0|nr:NAD(P)H-dependent oxidoreductase [Microvirga antarctica]
MDHVSSLAGTTLSRRPMIVGIGGTTKPDSTSEKALRACMAMVAKSGAETRIFGATDLDLPMYRYEAGERSGAVAHLVESLRQCTGVIISAPAYHGSIPGLIKNALDYVEDLSGDARPYLDGRPVACIVSAAGVQAMGTTLVSLRMIIHSLRGWPTPFGAVINAQTAPFDAGGECTDEDVRKQLKIVAKQVCAFISA